MNKHIACRTCRIKITSSPSSSIIEVASRRTRDFSISSRKQKKTSSIPEYKLRANARPHEKTCDPLRILFFGTDSFSVACLKALHKHREPLGIESIDVVTKTARRTGRGLKKLNSAPIKDTTAELSIPLHELSAFGSDWKPPQPGGQPINLLIAVSFGLLIPARIIESAKYGGLNVHPSPLPDLRGAAPIHHTLLQQRTRTQVCVQTLHPTKFDRGIVIERSNIVKIPEEKYDNLGPMPVSELRDTLAPVGAETLARTLYMRLFVPPLQERNLEGDVFAPLGVQTSAPKITKEDSHIDWTTDAHTIALRGRVLGELWSTLRYPDHSSGNATEIHVKFPRVDRIGDGMFASHSRDIVLPPGTPRTPGTVVVVRERGQETLAVRAQYGTLVLIREMTLAGKDRGQDPVESLRNLRRVKDAASLTKDIIFH